MSGDPYYNNVSLLLPLSGTDGSTTFTDYSPKPKTVSGVGGTAISNGKTLFGNNTLSLNGNAQYLSSNEVADFNLGTGDFTVELWFYANSLVNSPFLYSQIDVAGTTAGWFIELGTVNAIYFGFGSSPSFKTFSATLTAGIFYHIAVTRSGTTVNAFLDGVSLGEQTLTGANLSYNKSTPLSVGAAYSVYPNHEFNGYISNFRLTKGIIRYTTNFSVPTAPFDTFAPTILTNRIPIYIDSSGNQVELSTNDVIDANKISNTPSGSIVSTDLQSVFNEIDGDLTQTRILTATQFGA